MTSLDHTSWPHSPTLLSFASEASNVTLNIKRLSQDISKTISCIHSETFTTKSTWRLEIMNSLLTQHLLNKWESFISESLNLSDEVRAPILRTVTECAITQGRMNSRNLSLTFTTSMPRKVSSLVLILRVTLTMMEDSVLSISSLELSVRPVA